MAFAMWLCLSVCVDAGGSRRVAPAAIEEESNRIPARAVVVAHGALRNAVHEALRVDCAVLLFGRRAPPVRELAARSIQPRGIF
jgi:hypothetical protein